LRKCGAQRTGFGGHDRSRRLEGKKAHDVIPM